jgi:hypothetical protein
MSLMLSLNSLAGGLFCGVIVDLGFEVLEVLDVLEV